MKLIIVILIIIYFLYNKKKSSFWKHQYVCRNYGDLQIINKMPYRNIPKHNKDFIITPNFNFVQLSKFLNKHYVFGYTYSEKYLKQTLRDPTGITITHNNEIIGSIIGDKYKITHNNKTIHCYYIDYLCVHKNWRSQGICPLLIQCIINKFYPQKNLAFIFKIEENPLSFLPLANNKYYIIDLNTISLTNHKSVKELQEFKIPNENDVNDEIIIRANDYIKIIKYKKVVLYFTIETFQKTQLATIYGLFSSKKISKNSIDNMFSYLKMKYDIIKCVFLDTKYNKPLFDCNYIMYPSYDCRFYYYNVQFPKTYYGFENSINPI